MLKKIVAQKRQVFYAEVVANECGVGEVVQLDDLADVKQMGVFLWYGTPPRFADVYFAHLDGSQERGPDPKELEMTGLAAWVAAALSLLCPSHVQLQRDTWGRAEVCHRRVLAVPASEDVPLGQAGNLVDCSQLCF